MESSYLIYIIISLLFSAFFSGIEIAFVSSNKLHIELQSQQGVISGKILSKFLERPSSFIGTTLIGNTISLVVYGIYMAKMIEPILIGNLPLFFQNDVFILLAQTFISTIFVLFVAEFTPKSIFLLNPNGLLSFFALPLWLIYYITYPIVFFIVSLSKLFIKYVLRLKYEEDKPVFGLTDLDHFVKNTVQLDHQESKVELDKKIFNNALEFKTIKVRECMIPRTEVVAVDIEDTIEELKDAFNDSGHSKVLIYKDTIDDVIGYCHSLALFKKPLTIKEILTPIIIVPETMPANELMIQFIQEHKSLALVVDEFGGTSGIVSLEDIIEEIFGEIQDEHDDEDLVEEKISANTYVFSARLEIDYINDKYFLNLPEGDYDTLGGFILSITENFPQLNEEVSRPPFRFVIESMEENRINLVKLIITNSN
ncbi:hemolysin [Marivirga tractuosa]|uniref:CBS domain containing protein n=1 Tax=Marivirga tractuosa (strain ATCC 23168 / DSM 4126 / NBRC 15989 / NCIMB 1408 / VKM B-1430 / H-43) TaxID=643867 RepID=E4TTT7_MARTH|nr:hemolysin family protein [Marivirga tractuosa]ADR21992.1 CBS domain containing protein [Marivirga tractuosa DSM 4126]BDD13548.1 hemolysin [Marivirga tractuosa]